MNQIQKVKLRRRVEALLFGCCFAGFSFALWLLVEFFADTPINWPKSGPEWPPLPTLNWWWAAAKCLLGSQSPIVWFILVCWLQSLFALGSYVLRLELWCRFAAWLHFAAVVIGFVGGALVVITGGYLWALSTEHTSLSLASHLSWACAPLTGVCLLVGTTLMWLRTLHMPDAPPKR